MANTNLRDRYISDGAGVVPQPRLLIMLYDRLVLDCEQAAAAIDAGHVEVVNNKLIHAQNILGELNAALDHKVWAGAENLSKLYEWFIEQLIEANIKKDVKKVRTCHRLIRELQVTWHRAYEQVLAEQAAKATSAAATQPSAG